MWAPKGLPPVPSFSAASSSRRVLCMQPLVNFYSLRNKRKNTRTKYMYVTSRGGTPHRGLHREAMSERGPIFSLAVYERVLGRFVISVF